MMDAVSTSETSNTLYETTQHYIPEDSRLSTELKLFCVWKESAWRTGSLVKKRIPKKSRANLKPISIETRSLKELWFRDRIIFRRGNLD
jgi:hypothetical protein